MTQPLISGVNNGGTDVEAARQYHTAIPEDEEEDEEDEEERVLGMKGSVFWLFFITMFVSLMSEYVVDSIEASCVPGGRAVLRPSHSPFL